MTSQLLPLDGSDGYYVCQTFNGRLANHIFQYASIYGIAKVNNLTVLLGQEDDLVRFFKVPSAKILPNRRICDGFVKKFAKHCCHFDESFMYLQTGFHYKLGEYLQSWKYFWHVEDEVRKELTFKDDIYNSTKQILDGHREEYRLKLSVPELVIVGVHIRRGDLTAALKTGTAVVPAPDGYIHRAIDYILSKYTNVLFIVCSDGMDYARNITNYRNISVEYSHLSPVLDLALLSQTDHVITTVGTFGWWAGFLSRGTVVYYKSPIKEGTRERTEYNYDDFFPSHWIGLP